MIECPPVLNYLFRCAIGPSIKNSKSSTPLWHHRSKPYLYLVHLSIENRVSTDQLIKMPYTAKFVLIVSKSSKVSNSGVPSISSLLFTGASGH